MQSELNLCLGLKNKKFEVSQLLLNKQIDVICLQETEIDPHLNIDLLAIDGFQLELENNTFKARTGFYIKNKIPKPDF